MLAWKVAGVAVAAAFVLLVSVNYDRRGVAYGGLAVGVIGAAGLGRHLGDAGTTGENDRGSLVNLECWLVIARAENKTGRRQLVSLVMLETNE